MWSQEERAYSLGSIRCCDAFHSIERLARINVGCKLPSGEETTARQIGHGVFHRCQNFEILRVQKKLLLLLGLYMTTTHKKAYKKKEQVHQRNHVTERHRTAASSSHERRLLFHDDDDSQGTESILPVLTTGSFSQQQQQQQRQETCFLVSKKQKSGSFKRDYQMRSTKPSRTLCIDCLYVCQGRRKSSSVEDCRDRRQEYERTILESSRQKLLLQMLLLMATEEFWYQPRNLERVSNNNNIASQHEV